ncbi:MAG: DUF3108 domain-containing protein [Steroidobacteraceae bacterium]
MTRLTGHLTQWAAVALVAAAASSPAVAASAAPGVFQPSKVTFKAEYRGITAGTITISLLDAGQGNYIYETRANAGGLAKLIVHHEIREASTFTLENNQIRPLSYVLDDGSPDTSRDTRLEFDWKAGVAKGQHEDKPVELLLKADMQDRMSVQVWIMQKLAAGEPFPSIEFIDRNEIKDYVYTNEGTAKLKTAIGEIDTVIYSSTRPDSTRVSRFWYAPSLGFLPVRAEQQRKGKVETVLSVLKVERP